jgi:membrane fusion protein, multidrug efflux system
MARGPVEVTALSQDNVRVLGKGKLLLIDSIVDQASATMRLKAMFDNEDERLWPSDFVNARVLVELRHDVLTVPPAAVQRGPDGIYAWVVMPGDVVQARPIQSGPTYPPEPPGKPSSTVSFPLVSSLKIVPDPEEPPPAVVP